MLVMTKVRIPTKSQRFLKSSDRSSSRVFDCLVFSHRQMVLAILSTWISLCASFCYSVFRSVRDFLSPSYSLSNGSMVISCCLYFISHYLFFISILHFLMTSIPQLITRSRFPRPQMIRYVK